MLNLLSVTCGLLKQTWVYCVLLKYQNTTKQSACRLYEINFAIISWPLQLSISRETPSNNDVDIAKADCVWIVP